MMPNVIMPKMGDAMEEGTLLRWLKQVGDEVAVGRSAGRDRDRQGLPRDRGDRSRRAEQDLRRRGRHRADRHADRHHRRRKRGRRGAARGQKKRPQPNAQRAARTSASRRQSEPVRGRRRAAPTGGPRPMSRRRHPCEAAPAGATAGSGERLRASPLVKRLAAEHGIDLSSVTGTGPGGRIVRDDIAALLTGAPRVSPAPDQRRRPRQRKLRLPRRRQQRCPARPGDRPACRAS